MKTKLLRKFRARFDYKFESARSKCIFTDKLVNIDYIHLFDTKKGSSSTYTFNGFTINTFCFGTFMLQTFGVLPSKKRRKLLEKKIIKDNHKRWKDEF